MISDKTLEFIKNKLIEYNKAFGHLDADDFLTFGYIWTSEDGMGMLHSSSIHSFKTLDGLAKYIYNYICIYSFCCGYSKYNILCNKLCKSLQNETKYRHRWRRLT